MIHLVNQPNETAVSRVHSVYAPSQWEMTLHCNDKNDTESGLVAWPSSSWLVADGVNLSTGTTSMGDLAWYVRNAIINGDDWWAACNSGCICDGMCYPSKSMG